MKFTNIAVLAAALNLAVGSPVFEKKSRDLVANSAAKKALSRDVKNADLKARGGGYGYSPTPRPSVEDLHARAVAGGFAPAYAYTPTPRASIEDLKARAASGGYTYTPTPRASVEDLKARAANGGYAYTPTARASVEDLRV